MKKPIKNMAASVHARLLKRARAEGRPFNELLQYYAMERLLHRLSISRHRERFVLKGGLMLQFWGAALTRSTKDIDLLGAGPADVTALEEILRQVLAVPVVADGLRFDRDSVKGSEIRRDAPYRGVRVTLTGQLGNARVHLQVDVGSGDVITPAACDTDYPSLLDLGPSRLLGYPPETAIAEKFHALVTLDAANTRLKDFFDIWTLSRGRSFHGAPLTAAIDATFQRRGTQLPQQTPTGLTSAFHTAAEVQWRAFWRKARVGGDCPAFAAVVGELHAFLMPLVAALVSRGVPPGLWPPGGPWCGAPAGTHDTR